MDKKNPEKKDYFQIELGEVPNLIIPLENTTEVLTIPPGQICPIPGVKETLLGVINYHGKLLWIANISPMLAISYNAKNIRTQKNLTVIVLNMNGQQIGTVVSKLKGVVTLDSNQLEPIGKDYYQAKFKLDSYILDLIDLPTIFRELSK